MHRLDICLKMHKFEGGRTHGIELVPKPSPFIPRTDRHTERAHVDAVCYLYIYCTGLSAILFFFFCTPKLTFTQRGKEGGNPNNFVKGIYK